MKRAWISTVFFVGFFSLLIYILYCYFEGYSIKDIHKVKDDIRRVVVYQGYFRSTFLVEGKEVRGKFTGCKRTYYPSGKVKTVYTYDQGQLSGVSIDYFQDGRINVIANFREDKLEGLKRVYDPFQLRKSFEYKNDFLNGLSREYNPQGFLTYEIQYKDGKRNGPLKRYYERLGKVWYEEMYENDILHGVRKEWHENGKISRLETYRNGKREGDIREFYDNGQIRTEKSAIKGFLEGEYKKYYRNGALMEQGIYKKGRLDGEVLIYEDGVLSKGDVYQSGRRIKRKYYDEGGGVAFEEVY